MMRKSRIIKVKTSAAKLTQTDFIWLYDGESKQMLALLKHVSLFCFLSLQITIMTHSCLNLLFYCINAFLLFNNQVLRSSQIVTHLILRSVQLVDSHFRCNA